MWSTLTLICLQLILFLITKTTQWGVTAHALLNTGHHLAMETVKQNIYLSLCSSHTLTVCIFKSAPSLFFQSLHRLLWLSQPHFVSPFISQFFVRCFLSLADFNWIDSFQINFLSSQLLLPPSCLHLHSLLFQRQTLSSLSYTLSHCQCNSIGVRPPRRAQTQVDSYRGGEASLLSASWRPTCPPHTHTHAHLASGGSVSSLALGTCLSWCNIKSSHLIWTVIMS